MHFTLCQLLEPQFVKKKKQKTSKPLGTPTPLCSVPFPIHPGRHEEKEETTSQHSMYSTLHIKKFKFPLETQYSAHGTETYHKKIGATSHNLHFTKEKQTLKASIYYTEMWCFTSKSQTVRSLCIYKVCIYIALSHCEEKSWCFYKMLLDHKMSSNLHAARSRTQQ